MEIDTSKLSDCIDQINITKKYVNLAKNKAETIRIPSESDSYRIKLSSLKEDIATIINDLVSSANKIESKIGNVNDAEERSRSIIEHLGIIYDTPAKPKESLSGTSQANTNVNVGNINSNKGSSYKGSTSSGKSNASVSNSGNMSNTEVNNKIESEDPSKAEIEEPTDNQKPGTSLDDIYNKKIEQIGISEYLSNETANAIRETIISNAKEEKINIEEMTDAQFYKYVLIIGAQYMTIDEYLKVVEIGNNTYGTDQGAFTDLKTKNPEAYQSIKDKLINEYKLSDEDSEIFMQLINTNGDGAYAKNVNTIIEYFKDKPEEFKEIFGFDLYSETSDGKVIINDKELLVDYYFWGNSQGENATLIQVDEQGNAIINDDEYNIIGEEKFVNQAGVNWDELNDYLQSKSENLSCDSQILIDNKTQNYTSEQIIKTVNENLQNGKSVSIAVTAKEGESLQFIDTNTSTICKDVEGSYWAKVIGVSEDGIIVTSEGKRCIIGYEDLLQDSKSYQFTSDTINLKTK